MTCTPLQLTQLAMQPALATPFSHTHTHTLCTCTTTRRACTHAHTPPCSWRSSALTCTARPPRARRKRLQKMISTMRERMEAKLGNSNNNAFRMRRLFLMYDAAKSGRVHFEDFRNMCETFGMQLDDDSLMALYCVYDPSGTGYLEYEALVEQLMSKSDFSFYKGYVDNSQSAEDERRRQVVIGQLARKMKPVLPELTKVLTSFDAKGSGYLPRRDVLAGCAAMGVVLSPHELDCLAPILVTDEEGNIKFAEFVEVFAESE